MKYTIMSTEKLRKPASETETKSLLYLMNLYSDNSEIYYYVVDFFNDLTGMDKDITSLWDVQSKGAKNSSPNSIGKELVTLFKNYISSFDFKAYILFLGGVSSTVRKDSSKSVFGIDNIKEKSLKAIKVGLKQECIDKIYIDNNYVTDKNIDDFLSRVEFVIDTKKSSEYVRQLIKYKNIDTDDDKLNAIFNEIRDKQSSMKNRNILEGTVISFPEEALDYHRHLTSNQIKLLILQRLINYDFLGKGIPKYFLDIYTKIPPEERNEKINEIQQSCCSALFNNMCADGYWEFFETVYKIISSGKEKSVDDIYRELDKRILKLCPDLEYFSFRYMIAMIKEGME